MRVRLLYAHVKHLVSMIIHGRFRLFLFLLLLEGAEVLSSSFSCLDGWVYGAFCARVLVPKCSDLALVRYMLRLYKYRSSVWMDRVPFLCSHALAARLDGCKVLPFN